MKKLGETTLKLSPLGIGCANFSSLTRSVNEDKITDVVHSALDLGINYFDTADSYGQGGSETLLGKALVNKRHDAIIFTKFGYRFAGISAAEQSVNTLLLFEKLKPALRSVVYKSPLAVKYLRKVRKTILTQCFDANYAITSVERSLRRLGTDYIDCILLHNPPEEFLISEELVDCLNLLKRQGKIRYWGLSTESLQEVYNYKPDVIQFPANYVDAEKLDHLAVKAKNAGIGLISRQIFQDSFTMASSFSLGLQQALGVSSYELAVYLNLYSNTSDTMLVGSTNPANVKACSDYLKNYEKNKDIICAAISEQKSGHES